MSRLAFHRPARLAPPQLPQEAITLPTPPEAQSQQGAGSWITLALPLLSSIGMAAYMITFGRPILIVIGILFVLAAIGTTVATRTQLRNARRQGDRRQRLRYRSHVAGTRGYARQLAAAQRLHAAMVHPDPERLWAIVTGYERIWERRTGDEDFLHIRVGTGTAALRTPIRIAGRLDPLADYDRDSLRAAQRVINRFGTVTAQPAVIDLGGCGVLSVLGAPQHTTAELRALLCQVTVLHAPEDVTIALERSGPGDWEWVKWLPHTIEPDAAGPAGVVTLLADDPDALSDYLDAQLQHRADLAAVRRNHLGAGRTTAVAPRRLIVVFTGFAPVSDWSRSPLFAALLSAAGPHLGITLVFLVERESEEPSRVDLRLRVAADGALSVEGRADLIAADVVAATADQVEVALADLIARRLAPLRLTEEHEQILARTVSLTEMVLGADPSSADITARWAQASGDRLLRIPIGNDGDGEPVLLDLKESAQGGYGPHGLIVGATGAGKSELLRTLITGLSLTHPPDLLNYVLIDFKGGATFAPLTGLPHVAGLITNLSDEAAMVDRVQAALVGEQQRRQQMLRRAGNLDSIRDYQRALSAGGRGPNGEPLEPMPYLLIIVDEFSELLSGRPDFVDLFVQIGRVGRSLGMHLLLATQRLEEGRLRGLDSHLSYRICLRTFSAVESRTVIGTTDAYRLPSIPGSAYMKVDETIYQRLRVAHVSAPYQSTQDRAAADQIPGSSIVPFDASRPAAGSASAAPPVHDAATTELAVVVDRLSKLGRAVHQVWLPPLPAAIPMDYLTGVPALQPGRGMTARMWPQAGTLVVPIGVLDLPLQQKQQPLTMDFGGPHGHLAIVGAPQTGRSTALRTVMLAGMLTHTPAEMQFYCIDFGGGSLHQYAAAPHVGSVAGRTEHEKIGRILAEIRTFILEREALMRSAGIASVTELRALRAAGGLPDGVGGADVFLLIDNWGGLRGERESADADVTDIAARGLGVGVHLVLTASRWTELRSALRDSIGTRVELRLNDPSESEINRRMAIAMAAAVPGRGLAAPGAYFHLVLPRLDGQESVEGGYEAQQDVLAKIAAGWAGPVAPPVRMLPDRLELADIIDTAVPTAGGRAGVPIGIAEADLNPVTVDLGDGDPYFAVLGDARAGKTGFLRTFIHALAATSAPWQTRMLLVDYRRTLLGAVDEEYLAAYAPDTLAATTYIAQLCDQLTTRLPPPGTSAAELAARTWWSGADIYLLVDDYDMVAPGVFAPLVDFLPHAHDIGLRVVVTRRVTGFGRSAYSDRFYTRIQELGCGGLVLSGDRKEGAVLGDERAALRPPGRGMLVRRGEDSRLIQIAVTGDQPAVASAPGSRS